jgi:hypothetical protein
MKKYHTHESGNAVTLTLLGLAVAIFAGVAVLYVLGKQKPVPVPMEVPSEIAKVIPPVPQNPREGWEAYENVPYNFSFEYPGGWAVAEGEVLGVPVITVYDTSVISETGESNVHDALTRVSVYPAGLPVGGTGDREEQSTFSIDGATVQEYVTGTTSQPWARIVRFTSLPSGWSEDGFLYARVQIMDEEITYMRNDDVRIEEDEYDSFVGDRIVRDGFVDPEVRAITDEVLRSFRILEAELMDGGTSTSTIGNVSDMLRVTTPTDNAVVTSPLHVSGEARGNWYFEGSFPVEVRNADGEVLAQVPAPALGDWMTEAFVPFEVSVSFDVGTATSGVVRFIRDNPSGLSEFDTLLEVPVRF